MKRLLTPEFVNEVSPPEKGERWIADTKIRNFGLRLWATKSGGSKAYCLRLGSKKRLTFDPYRDASFTIQIKDSFDSQLGSYLQSARNWAYQEIERYKVSPLDKAKLLIEENTQRNYFRNYVRELTLEKAAMCLLDGRKKLGYSESYTDELDRLFNNWEANELKQTPLSEIIPEHLARKLVNQKYSWGNIRALRMFISKVYRQASEFSGSLSSFNQELSAPYREELKDNYTVKCPELIGLNEEVYEVLFNRLESHSERWQQAMCIRLFFEFGAPLSRLMSARWCEIHDGYWYPYAPAERSLWFEGREPIREKSIVLLEKLASNIKKDFEGNDYWFPSPHSTTVTHITTVTRLWKKTVKELGFEGIPLREFALSYRSSNTPSYNYARDKFSYERRRETCNVAELSKMLYKSEKKNNTFNVNK